MPIEIKELLVRVAVQDPEVSAHLHSGESFAAPAVESSSERELIVAQCVEQILQILDEKRQR